jgi:ABC-2 type transport system ATP-binding protein
MSERAEATAVSLRGVTKSYDRVTAVDSLTLTVPRGAIYGFIGPNGSGKTTTLRMIMNILLPDRGEIEVLGEKTTLAARDRVSYLPEERGLYKKMTVRRLLRYYARLKGMGTARADERIDDWLARLELAGWADKKVETLSKGMAQKVQFIAAAACEPELLILDEPFSGLDPVNADVLKDAVLGLRKQRTTIVFSTHDMAVAEKMCDRIFMIFEGRKVLDGTLEEIQAAYGADTVLVRTSGGPAALDGAPEIESVNDRGNEQEVRLRGRAPAREEAQALLRRLVATTEVQRFEMVRPSLHDIFVRIAAPAGGAGTARS